MLMPMGRPRRGGSGGEVLETRERLKGSRSISHVRTRLPVLYLFSPCSAALQLTPEHPLLYTQSSHSTTRVLPVTTTGYMDSPCERVWACRQQVSTALVSRIGKCFFFPKP
jgi:hypothetical protein